MLELYRDRKIAFHDVVEAAGWQVKVYTITNKAQFAAQTVRDQVLAYLPAWLSKPHETALPVYKHAFLIIHEAREGVWILLNWWTGGEMIQRSTWFTSLEEPPMVMHQPEHDGLVCVWELEVMFHERKAWIKHVLQHPENPQFDHYTEDTL